MILVDIENPVSEYVVASDVESIANGTSSQYFALKSIKTLKKVFFESPSSLKFLGHYSFYQCTLLKELDFSNCTSLENIGSFCFFECTGIERITFPTQSKLEILDYACFCSMHSVESYSLPSSLRYINGNASEFGCFRGFSGNELRFNEGLLSIGPCACIYIRCHYVYLPSSLIELDSSVLRCNDNLIEIFTGQSNACVVVNKALLSYDQTLLYAFPSLISGTYYVPNTVQIICTDAFCYSMLNEIILPDSCTELETLAFFHLRNLVFMKIPNSVVKVHDDSINDCPNLRNLTIEMERIPKLHYQSVEIMTLGNETKVIEDYALINAVNLQSIIIPPSVVKIGAEAFRGLKKLRCVRIYGQPSIGSSAFKDTRISCGIDCYSSLIDPLMISGVNSKSFNYCCMTAVVQNAVCFRSLLDFQCLVFNIV